MIIDFEHKFKLEEENFDYYKCCRCGNVLINRHNDFDDDEAFYRDIEYLECCDITISINNYDEQNNINKSYYYIEGLSIGKWYIVYDKDKNNIVYSLSNYGDVPVETIWYILCDGSKFALNKELIEKLERLSVLL